MKIIDKSSLFIEPGLYDITYTRSNNHSHIITIEIDSEITHGELFKSLKNDRNIRLYKMNSIKKLENLSSTTYIKKAL
jgi:hypothetical protein